MSPMLRVDRVTSTDPAVDIKVPVLGEDLDWPHEWTGYRSDMWPLLDGWMGGQERLR